jgi:hypothetical protein
MPPKAALGHRAGVWSLLMLPFLIVSGGVAAMVALALYGQRDLEGSEPMSVQGAYGWMVLAVTGLILLTPMLVGLVLGAKARRLGEKRLGTIGMVLDGLVVAGYVTLTVTNSLGQ